jgi:hypothetical protein
MKGMRFLLESASLRIKVSSVPFKYAEKEASHRLLLSFPKGKVHDGLVLTADAKVTIAMGVLETHKEARDKKKKIRKLHKRVVFGSNLNGSRIPTIHKGVDPQTRFTGPTLKYVFL